MPDAACKDAAAPRRRKRRRHRISVFDYALAVASMIFVMGGLLGATFYAFG